MQLLVVEDNPATLKMLAFLLRNEGYAVHTAVTGRAGLDLLRREEFDLLVLDMVLPDHTGLDICRWARREGLHLPILILSALSSAGDKLAALEGGADDYLTKPFDPAEVVARVHSLIRRTQAVFAPELQTRLCVGPVCLDVHNGRAEAAGGTATLPLTRMEAQLFHVLLRNAGHVVSHERLILDAWGADYAGSSNQLEVYIHRLRGKLRSLVGDQELIRTAPASGYEMVAPPAHPA